MPAIIRLRVFGSTMSGDTLPEVFLLLLYPRLHVVGNGFDHRNDDGISELAIGLRVGHGISKRGRPARSNPMSRAHSRGVRRRGPPAPLRRIRISEPSLW